MSLLAIATLSLYRPIATTFAHALSRTILLTQCQKYKHVDRGSRPFWSFDLKVTVCTIVHWTVLYNVNPCVHSSDLRSPPPFLFLFYSYHLHGTHPSWMLYKWFSSSTSFPTSLLHHNIQLVFLLKVFPTTIHSACIYWFKP